ncbi:ABC transporter ATP-binding protein [Peribacillus frigoritolerans]|uniref:ATP-binding cassette domain-containing protein n=1 Tax=Peribacillus frigoritolerans TaxID=450367 RepID=UPI00345CCF32
MQPDNILKIENLCINIGRKKVLHNIHLQAKKGRILGIVGESGSGKSTLCRAITQQLPPSFQQTDGSILFNHYPLTKESKHIGSTITSILQNPLMAFDTIQTIEGHFFETLKAHRKMERIQMSQLSELYLKKVQLYDTNRILKSYPFELSGGMLQRIMIALALISKPQLVIADEPTTALDMVTQHNILTLLRTLQNQEQLTMLLITHDLGVIAALADDVAVIYNGEVIEYTDVYTCFDSPVHPHTKQLLEARL